jgi:nicotinate phosphoribosyltransferase
LACGLDTVLEFLERLRFTEDDIRYVASLGGFSPRFLDSLRAFRFTGEVHAVPEGTPVFANEPILEVVAPIAQGQLIETLVMNQVHLQTLLASKAARVVAAARGRTVVDFGARRMHGIDAALKAARAFHIAGVGSTSNVVAGRAWGIPVAGTMAHSYIQAHDSEEAAFEKFAALYPDTILLVDTYDTLAGVRRVIDLARRLGGKFRVSAVRLDSGDLAALAKQSRALLDAAGLQRVKIFASGGLDEDEVAKMLDGGAPVDGFGVGTAMGVSEDKPALDIAYKLSEYAGKGRLKLSTGKPVLPGRKQIFRREDGGRAAGDTIGCDEETLPGRLLMRTVMENGRRLPGAAPSLAEIRAHAERETALLPDRVRHITPARPPYAVEISARLQAKQDRIAREITAPMR